MWVTEVVSLSGEVKKLRIQLYSVSLTFLGQNGLLLRVVVQ